MIHGFMSVDEADTYEVAHTYQGRPAALNLPGGSLLGVPDLHLIQLSTGEQKGHIAEFAIEFAGIKVVVTRDPGLNGVLLCSRLEKLGHGELRLHGVHPRYDDSSMRAIIFIEDPELRLDLELDGMHSMPADSLRDLELEQYCIRPVVIQHRTQAIIIGNLLNTPVFGTMDPRTQANKQVSIALGEGYVPRIKVLERIKVPMAF